MTEKNDESGIYGEKLGSIYEKVYSDKIFSDNDQTEDLDDVEAEQVPQIENPDWATELNDEELGEEIDHWTEVERPAGTSLDLNTLDGIDHLSAGRLEKTNFEGLDVDELSSTRSFSARTADRVKEHLGLNAFAAASNAVDTDYWGLTMMDRLEADLGEMIGGESSDVYRELIDPIQSHDSPTRQHNYEGQAGELSLEQFGRYLTKTDTQYSPAEDARPVSEMAHAALMHAAGVLMRYDAETEEEGIRVENLDAKHADEIVKAYTVMDYLLQSENWDQRTIRENLYKEMEALDQRYGTEDRYDLQESLE